MTSADGRESRTSARTLLAKGSEWVVAASVFAAFLAYSAYCRPAPSVNEPHYLCKAKHYWQPEWCAEDLFLTSSNPHQVFYQTFGILTTFLSLTTAAWTGRVIVLCLLAWGWTRLTSLLLPSRWAPFAAACLFVLLQALGSFSGEWLVGGVESKVVSYALALAGISFLLEGRPVPMGVCFGGAVSFHPVVGTWFVICISFSAVVRVLAKSFFEELPPQTAGDSETSSDSSTAKSWFVAVGLFVVCSLPGFIPALRLLDGGDPEAVARANLIQVGLRLKHHLDPTAFGLSDYRYYGLLIVIGWLTSRSTPPSKRWRWFAVIVAASVLVAVAGICVGWGPRPLQEMPLANVRVWLMKFYPFRLADVLLPMWVACTMVLAILHWSASAERAAWKAWIGRILPMLLLVVALLIPTPDRNPSRMTEQVEADWRSACEWIRTESPREALLYAANEDWAVKWFSHRAEYVNYKDCPQDPAGVLEWVRRLKRLEAWLRTSFRDGRCSSQELSILHQQTGITHLLVSRLGPVDAAPIYQNESFRVYETAGTVNRQ